jgi:hypothetical protein
VSSATITLCVASQRVFIILSSYFVIDSVRKLLDTPSYGAERQIGISYGLTQLLRPSWKSQHLIICCDTPQMQCNVWARYFHPTNIMWPAGRTI